MPQNKFTGSNVGKILHTVLMGLVSGRHGLVCGTFYKLRKKREAGEGENPAYLVYITAGDTAGSVIIYSVEGGKLYVLTAAHVVEGLQATVRFCDGWEAGCGEIVVSETADLAMLRLSTADIPRKRLEKYQCVETDKEGFDALRAGDGCTAEGFSGGMNLVRHEGSVLEPWIYMEDYGQYMIWADAELQAGMSGGGLFDSGGNFIGILSGGNKDGELAAVPFSLVLQFCSSSSDNPSREAKIASLCDFARLAGTKTHSFAFCVHYRNSSVLNVI